MMNIYQSMTKIMEEVPAIGKEQTNTTQHFKYRGIDDVMNAIQPLFAKYKVFPVPELLEQKREERIGSKGGTLIYSVCKIKYKFFAEDGTFVEAIVIGEGMDSGDKSSNKAMAAAMKYAICQILCIPTKDIEDPDNSTPEDTIPMLEDEEKGKKEMEKELDTLVTAKEAIIVRKLMEDKGLDVPKQLMANYKISSTKELTKRQYASILNAIKNMPNKK